MLKLIPTLVVANRRIVRLSQMTQLLYCHKNSIDNMKTR